MKKYLIAALALGITASSAYADVTFRFPQGVDVSRVFMTSRYIDPAVITDSSTPVAVTDTLQVKAGTVKVASRPLGPAMYSMAIPGSKINVSAFASPGEDIVLTLDSVSLPTYKASGSALMEDIALMQSEALPVIRDFVRESRNGEPDRAKLDELSGKIYDVYRNYLKQHPGSPAAVWALINLTPDEFLAGWDTLTPEARKSIIYPLAQQQKAYFDQKREADERKAAMESGSFEAPNFTFKDRNGKDVSLSDYKGKWVVIDFWGSWCYWCIKGIPDMKEAYAKYQPELVIIGIACNDTREAWIKALDKYEMPWVNVFNPTEGGGPLLMNYGVEGFPTKVIVNPEGKIVKMVSGESPEFYTALEQLLKK